MRCWRPMACCVVAAFVIAGSPAAAQSHFESADTFVPSQSLRLPTAPVPPVERSITPPVGPAFSSLFTDLPADFRNLPTRQNLTWLGIAAAASALAAPSADASTSHEFSELVHLDASFSPGGFIGSAPAQFGGALLTYTIGRSLGSSRTARVGSELFRAQAVAQALSYGIKWTSRRTRPDGTSFSFPSGHTAVSFASATVLQRNYGWKAGAPAYLVASYVAASRVQQKRHFVSDVAFGAVLGLVAGRTVSVGLAGHRFALAPMAAPGGGGVSLTLVSPR